MADIKLSQNAKEALDAIDSLEEGSNPLLRIDFPAANKSAIKPGTPITVTEAQDPTQRLAKSVVDAKGAEQKYIAISVDTDAPFPSYPFLAPILHGVQTDLVAVANDVHANQDSDKGGKDDKNVKDGNGDNDNGNGGNDDGDNGNGNGDNGNDNDWVLLKSETEPLVSYIPPNPPPFSVSHRYIFFVWEQPAELDLAKVKESLGWAQGVSRMMRMRWDMPTFEKEFGLEKPVACNYFATQR